MRLKTPGDLQAAIDNVDLLARELADCLKIPQPNAQHVREAWLKWWAGADMKLRELFAEDDLLVPLAQTATEIRNLDLPAPAYEAPMLSFIVRERDVWVDRLDNAVWKLKQLKDFVMRPGRVAVLDTSAFHEFDRFWLADWAKVAEADSPYESMACLPIRLVVPLVVVEELDAQKRHPSGKVRAAARDILRNLRDLQRVYTDAFADVLRLDDRVTVEILLDDPAHVRLPVNDAEIIDRAVYLRSLFPTSRRVILVSSDVAMEFRAEGAGLETRHVARDVSGDAKAQED
jgi:rRNA-processing protein FCF1